jgi:hypothetical protein
MIAFDFPLLDIFWTVLEIFALVVWLWLLVSVFADIFRSHDMGGAVKALWVVFILVFPLLGLIAYLIARGGGMHERMLAQTRHRQQPFDDYIRQTTEASSQVDALAKLADLKERGLITEAEFEKQKAKLLA